MRFSLPFTRLSHDSLACALLLASLLIGAVV